MPFNNLEIVHSRVFEHLSSIGFLDLSYNKILYIDKNEFRNMKSLVELNLKNNKLQFLDTNLIQGCFNLKKFCLDGNFFTQNFSLNFYGLVLDQQGLFDPICEIDN